MTIVINGQEQDVGAESLETLIINLGLKDDVVATALNGVFVARTKRGQTALQSGDRVEIVAPMQGG